MILRTYTLPPEETSRAIACGGPLADLAADPTRLEQMRIAVVEVDGAIVAYWVVWYALHVEPLWVTEPYRKHPAVIRGIVSEMQRIVEDTQEPAAFCVIEPENLAVVAQYATRLGFAEAPGKLYYVVAQPLATPEER